MFTTPKKLLASGFAIAMLATACGDDVSTPSATPQTSSGDDTVTVGGGDIQLTSGLASFGSCDALLTHLQTEGAERVGPWGFNHGNYWGGNIGIMEDGEMVEDAMADMAMDDSADATTSETSAQGSNESFSNGDGALTEGEDFSGTNNQEAGVDEPDYVKTNGERILTMTNGRFTYIDANDGSPEVRGSITLGHSTQEMLVVGDRVYLFGTSYGEQFYPEPMMDDVAMEDGGDAEAGFATDEAAGISRPGTFQGPSVEIIELDVSNADDLSVTANLSVEGHYLSARLVDGTISVAIQSDQHDLGFVFPQGTKGEETAEKFNKEIVMDTTISDWLPSYSFDGSEGQLTDCADVHAPADFAGFGSLSVISIDGTTGLDNPAAASVLASGQNIYASTNTMWISTNQWYDWASFDDDQRQAAEDSFTSQIHGFTISGDSPEYLASGSVRGYLLNQFAMSEHDGVLRVATTDGTMWGNQGQSESFITTFDIEENELVQLGQVGEMGKGEQIFAVRFVGETAYVVTFRQTDPFYTVDLSNPASPQVLGELKITGFSGQLHPLGPNHVLGIGQEATEEGFQTGAKVTLFDVSDLANPIDVDTWTVENSWSDAQWDHKAFLWWPQEKLAVLPVQNWSEQFWGAVAFRIDLDEGTVTEAGRLTHEPEQGDVVGRTDCEVIDPAAFAQFRGEENELGYMSEEISFMVDDGAQIQDCGQGQTGATGLSCERWDWIQMSAEQEADLGLDGTLEFCWPEGPGQDPIVRTLVIGDTLWSLSWSRLQANDLGDFTAGAFVELGR